MKLAAATALALPLFAAAPAFATVITLDFETVGSFASIDTYYAGGTDSDGNVGPALGVTFGLDVLGLQNDAAGPYFSNAPSPLGVMTVVGAASTMNVEGGFRSMSFFYSSADAVADAVEIWSGPDGTGALLASLSLSANAQASGCSDSPFCNFDRLSAALGTRAYSVTFANASNVAAFDDVALDLPEPTTALLVALGLAGAALGRRR